MRFAKGILGLLVLFCLTSSTASANSPRAVEYISVKSAYSTCTPLLNARDARVPCPELIAEYVSSSGKTIIQYYHYISPSCGADFCDFGGTITTYPGFDLTEVFLSGFSIETESSEAKIGSLSAGVSQFRYLGDTGALEIVVNAVLVAEPIQNYSYETVFGVILTDSSVAHLADVRGSCTGTATCQIQRVVTNAVPSNMQFIGLGMQEFHWASTSGPILINALGTSTAQLIVSGNEIETEQTCAFHGVSQTNNMFCEYDSVSLAFEPSEMDMNNGPMSPRVVITNTNVTETLEFSNSIGGASDNIITGSLNALEAMRFNYPARQEEAIWAFKAMGKSIAFAGRSPTEAESAYSIFLGSVFGDRDTTAPFDVEMSRSIGLLQ